MSIQYELYRKNMEINPIRCKKIVLPEGKKERNLKATEIINKNKIVEVVFSSS